MLSFDILGFYPTSLCVRGSHPEQHTGSSCPQAGARSLPLLGGPPGQLAGARIRDAVGHTSAAMGLTFFLCGFEAGDTSRAQALSLIQAAVI